MFASHPSLASVVVECPPLWSENRMVARTRNNSVWSLPLLKTKMMRFRDLTSITYQIIISNKKRLKWQQKTTNVTKLQNCFKRKSSRSHCNSGARPCNGMKMMNSMRISLMSWWQMHKTTQTSQMMSLQGLSNLPACPVVKQMSLETFL